MTELAEIAWAALASIGLLGGIFIPLEGAFRARPQAQLRRAALGLDALFLAGQYLLWNGATFWLLAALQGALALRSELPLGCQATLAIVIGDLSVYWFHRACHRFDLLWRFHAVHHSAEALDWVAAHREHPLDGIATSLVVNLPAFALGFRPEAIAPFLVLRGLWAVFVHSNVRLPLGPLKWLFGAPELHRWHHARSSRTRHNFANVAPWIDVVFGTHYEPETDDYALGLEAPMPRSYLGLLFGPFSRRRVAVAASRALRRAPTTRNRAVRRCRSLHRSRLEARR